MGSSNNNEYKEKKYIWVDPDIENNMNKAHYNNIFKKRKIDCVKFDNVDKAYNYLIQKENEFTQFIITISGKLFCDLCKKMNKNMVKDIKFVPNIIIFTSRKKLFINSLKMNNLYYNNKLLDTNLIFTQEKQVENYIDGITEEGNDLTFDIMENLEQLIIPNYYSYLFEDTNIYEIQNFIKFLKTNFSDTKAKDKKSKKEKQYLNELVRQLDGQEIDKSIILKYWLKIYSLQTKFYSSMNKSLRNKNKDRIEYYPFIKLCYEGIKKKYIFPYHLELYRYSKMTKKEFENLQKMHNELNLNNNKQYPGMITYSRSFLSFSMGAKSAEHFKGSDKNTFCILYIIEEIKDAQNLKNIISNVIMTDISKYAEEKEVLVFPFSCFEILEIKEIKADDIDYEIHLKYLGNYSQLIKDQFSTNFFDKIQISTFSEELIDSNALTIKNFYSKWENDCIYNIKLDKICFFLDGKEDLICISNNDIIIFNINISKIKQIIKIHQKKILDIYKLPYNRICSCSEDNTIKIIELKENNTKYFEEYNKNLGEKYAVQINFLDNFDLCFIDNTNNIAFFEFQKTENRYEYNYKCIIQEKNKILKMKILNNGKIVYINENQEGNKFINFINIREKKKEENTIQIEETEEKLKFIDLLLFSDYIIIVFNHRIDIINSQINPCIIKSLKYFTFEITNITKLSSNRIILGAYDSDKKESIIREILLRIDDLLNDKYKFDCIGLGFLKNKKIENIIKKNESEILLNIKNECCLLYERSNEISDKLKQTIMSFDEIKINKINKVQYLNPKKEEEEKNNDINFNNNFNYNNYNITPICSKNNNKIFEKKGYFMHQKMKSENFGNNYNNNNYNLFNQDNKYNFQFDNYNNNNYNNGNININLFQKNNNNIILNDNIELQNFNKKNNIEININNINKQKEKNNINNMISFLPKAHDEKLEENPNKYYQSQCSTNIYE